MTRLNTLRRNSRNSSDIPTDMPNIRMPFPPNMTAEEFLRNRPLSRSYFKSPNSFFIYRQQFVKQLKLENYNDQMIKVSKWASIFWSNEPNYVKQYYKNIEKNIQKLLNEQCKNERNNPCQVVCPEFIFEYPNGEDKKDDNNNSNNNNNNNNNNNSNNVNDSPVVDTTDISVADLLQSSSENSPTMQNYPSDELLICNFEESDNFFSFLPQFITTPPTTSPTFPIYQQNNFHESNDTTLIDNNNFESYINLFDKMDEYSFLSNDENSI